MLQPSEWANASEEAAIRGEKSLVVRFLRPFLIALVAGSVVILAAMMWLQLLRASKMVYGEMRGAPSLALAAGRGIYQGVQIKGPLFCVVYAPLSYLLYTPIAFFKEPKSALMAGSMLALGFYSLPLIYVMARFRREPRRSSVAAAGMPLLFFSFTLCAAPLAYSSTYLHADAPALGFGGLAACILFFHHQSTQWTAPWICALMTILAMGCKQSVLPLAVILPAIAFFLESRAFFARYLIALPVLGASAALFFLHDASGIFLNAWTIPRRFPLEWSKAPVVLSVLHESCLPLLFTGVAMAIAALSVPSKISSTERRLLVIFPAVAVVLLPGSLMGMLLRGGDQNALSPFVYFALLSLLGLVYGSTSNAWPVAPYWAGAILATAGLLVPVAMREQLSPSSLKQALDRGSSEIAFEYDRRYPGRVYFPDHQLSVYLAEGRFYHSDWGVGDYALAGFPIGAPAVWNNIPAQAAYVAYPILAPGDWLLPYIAPHRIVHYIPELPGFEVFEIER